MSNILFQLSIKCTRYLLVKILINEFLTIHVLKAKRGFATAAVFVFFLVWVDVRLGFQQKTSLKLRGAMDLREEINPPQAEQ